ncbi:unnamed protein product, partial [Rotaria magnacalcarata]
PPSIVNNGQLVNEITRVKGESLVLTCLLRAIPLPTIIWTKNDQVLFDTERISMKDNDFQLHIENISLNDRGSYQCQAENLAGRSQQIFDVQVYIPPEIHLSNINLNPYVVLGKNIVLSCSGFGVPEINYQWFKDERSLLESHSYARLLENGARLQIDTAHSSDAGHYSCQMSNIVGQVNLTYQLDVFIPPTIDRSNLVETYQIKFNQTARLECPMYGKPEPHIMWLINGRDLNRNNDRYELMDDNRVLIINSVNLHDNARYTCIGTNIAGELSNHIDLQIFVPPTIQRDPTVDSVNVIQNHHIALTCKANGDPSPSVSWEKDGLPVDTVNSRYRIGPAGFQLLIIQAEPSQAGIYTCLAYSKAGEVKEQFRLIVLVPPRIQRENTSFIAVAPKPIELPCNVIQGHPAPIVKWFHDDIELKVSDGNINLKYIISSSNSLLLLHTSKYDDGKYQCMIINEAGHDSIDFHLDIYVPPTVMVESNEIIGIVNTPITLNCHADGYPLPVVYWTKAGRSIDGQPGFQTLNNGSLRIHHLRVQDTGYYLCWAENLVQRTYAQIRLEVQVPPSIDQIEKYYSGTVGQSIKLSCQANGIPIPTITWHGVYNVSGTASIDSFGNLYISQLERYHEGEIICYAQNTIGQTSKTFTLMVLDHETTTTTEIATIEYEPNSKQILFLIISPNNLIVDYGDTLELICQTNSIKPFDIQWLHNGHLVDRSNYLVYSYDRSFLQITKANDEHTGIYQCFLNDSLNQQFIISMPITVTVRPHPNSQHHAIITGHRLILSCEIGIAEDVNFLGTIEWFHNGSPLKQDSLNRNRIDYRNGTLIIDQTSGSDAGVYKCVFEGDNGTRLESYRSVNILTQPTFTIKLPRSTLRPANGSMLMLNCLADAWPEPTLKWTKNGTILTEIDGVRLQLLPNNSLKIDPVQVSDTGRYTCSAENALGTATTTCDVIVYEVPLTTSIRHLHGELKRISIDNIELHSNSIFKRATLNKVQSNMVPLFQTLSVFLFPPSLITLTTPMAMIENVSSSFCSIDDAYQRDMIISFADGSHVNIIERVSDKRIEFNGSYPDNYEFKNSTFFTETMVQTDSEMNFTINTNDTAKKSLNQTSWLGIRQQKIVYAPVVPSHSRISRSQYQQHRKTFSYIQIIEISFLCFILIENLIIFIITNRKRKLPKQTLCDANDQQQQQQQQQHRSIVFLPKSLLYNCLHPNWIRAYSFSNICLSCVYFITLILKHYHPNLLHYSSITFYSLPLTLVQQILINFNTFHLFIISISILQYFIRYHRLSITKQSLNISSASNLLITKHTNVALILSGSLALIFGYNYIFYSPKYSQTIKLLPLIALNMILLPLIDCIIFVFIIICCIINQYKYNILIEQDLLFDNESQQQHLANSVRSIIEKTTCIKCYSKFLQQNRNLFQDTSDPYTNLHSRLFGPNPTSSGQPSLTPSDEKRKYSTISYDNISIMANAHSRLHASYPCQTPRNFLSNKCNRSQQDFSNEQPNDTGRSSENDFFLQGALIKLKRQRSYCHLCYRLLLLFLLKYVLFTFPQHFIQMIFHLKQVHEYIIKYNPSNNNNNQQQQQQTRNNSENILSEHNEIVLTVCRFLFLIARFGDSFLLTCLPNLIRKYFPCWCHFNSKLLCKQKQYQQQSHQILMRNTDSQMNERVSFDEASNSNNLSNQQELHEQRKQSNINESSHGKHQHFRLHFQFVPIWSNKRKRIFKENY